MVEFLPTGRPPVPDLETAGDRDVLVDRVVATVVDVSICLLVFVVPLVYLPRVLSVPLAQAFNPFLVAYSLVILVPFHATYAFTFEWQYDRTPGKTVRGLVVATTEGESSSLRASAVRNLLRYVDLLPGPYLVGLASALRSSTGQRIGDVAAGTVVVRTEPSGTTTAGQPG